MASSSARRSLCARRGSSPTRWRISSEPPSSTNSWSTSVQHERLNLSGDPVGLAQELRSLVAAPEAVAAQVTEIIARVRASGDDALRFYTREYDTGGTTPAALRVPEAELDTAEARLDDAVREGLRIAIDNVTKVAEAGLASEQSVAFEGHE